MNINARLDLLEQQVNAMLIAMGTLSAQVRQLQDQVTRGPDPRLWAGDPHDPHR